MPIAAEQLFDLEHPVRRPEPFSTLAHLCGVISNGQSDATAAAEGPETTSGWTNMSSWPSIAVGRSASGGYRL